jgi:prepilin-type N-terminal cleavage/methylation domain-containing protein
MTKTVPSRIPHSAFKAFRIRSAFTLVELIAAALILGILAAAAAPSLVSSIMYHRVESAAVRLKRDLELARQTAVSKSASFSVEFSGTTYTIPNLDSLDHTGQTYQVDLFEPPHSVLVTSVDFGGSTSVTFNGFGMPSSSGAVVLSAGSHQRRIDLNDQGHVSVSK